jgi:hypothetical protein
MRKNFCLGIFAFFIFATVCSASDILVYDAGGQRIGILLGINEDHYGLNVASLDVFLTELNKIASITIPKASNSLADLPDDLGDLFPMRLVFFKNGNCTGEAGGYETFERIIRYQDVNNTTYYGYMKISEVLIDTYYSMYVIREGQCTSIPSGQTAHPITAITAAELPFQLPITFPIRYQYQTESKPGGGKPPR